MFAKIQQVLLTQFSSLDSARLGSKHFTRLQSTTMILWTKSMLETIMDFWLSEPSRLTHKKIHMNGSSTRYLTWAAALVVCMACLLQVKELLLVSLQIEFLNSQCLVNSIKLLLIKTKQIPGEQVIATLLNYFIISVCKIQPKKIEQKFNQEAKNNRDSCQNINQISTSKARFDVKNQNKNNKASITNISSINNN